MAKVRVKHLYIPKATTYVYEITYVTKKNVPIDITGYTADLKIKRLDSEVVLYHATTANGKLSLISESGIIRLIIPVSENDFDWGEATYDCEVTVPGTAEVFRLVKGSVFIDSDGAY